MSIRERESGAACELHCLAGQVDERTTRPVRANRQYQVAAGGDVEPVARGARPYRSTTV